MRKHFRGLSLGSPPRSSTRHPQRLDLAAKERLPVVFPPAVVSDQRHRPADPVRARVYPQIMQQLKCWHRGGPGLALILVALNAPGTDGFERSRCHHKSLIKVRHPTAFDVLPPTVLNDSSA